MPWTWFLFFHAYLKSPHKIYKQRPKDPWLFAACLGYMGWKKASSPALFDLIVRDLWPQRLGLWQSRAGHERNKKDFTYMLEPEFWIFNKIKTHSFLLETKLIHRSFQRTRPFTYLLALFFVPNCSKKYGCKKVFLWMYYRFKVCFSFACVQLVYSLSSTVVAASSNTIQRGDKACFLCCFGGVASMRETERARALLFCSEKKKVLKRKKSEGKERRCEQCQAKPLFFVFWPLENYVVPCEGKKFYIDPHIFPLLPFGSWLYFIFFAYSISDPHSCCLFFFLFRSFSFFFFCSHKSNKILKKSQTHEKLTKG